MPATPQEQFDELIRCAEKYIRSPGQSKATAVMRWRNKAMRWLKTNARDSDLSFEFVTTSPPSDNSYGRGITRTSVIGVQKGLRVLKTAEETLPMFKNGGSQKLRTQDLKKVFIVHGHDDLLKASAARFVTKLQLEPVVLHEQPNHGRTIIEKFIDYSDVGYAMVLLSPDDRGGIATDAADTYRPRARQNVIFELGFFIGKLGRGRVVALHRESVEIPSDYSGVLFIPFDPLGHWEIQVAREMRAAGMRVDFNKL